MSEEYNSQTSVESSCGELADVTVLKSRFPVGMPGLTEPLASRPPRRAAVALTLGVGGVAVAALSPYDGRKE